VLKLHVVPGFSPLNAPGRTWQACHDHKHVRAGLVVQRRVQFIQHRSLLLR